MRIALTGQSGFTGTHVARAIRDAGHEPVPLACDLSDREATEQAVENAKFDRLIHLAAHAFVARDDWAPFYEINQLGTLGLLAAVARFQPGTRCIVASSAQIYGAQTSGIVNEDVPANPLNHYAIGKYAMELGAAQFCPLLDIVLARPFNYTGVGQSEEYLVPKIVAHFRRRDPKIQLGNTWVRRDFGDVRSVAQAYVGLALAEEIPRVVNICTGTVSSIDEIIGELSYISGHDIAVVVDPALVRPNDVEELGGDPARLRAYLPQWRPRPLADTLRWMYEA